MKEPDFKHINVDILFSQCLLCKTTVVLSAFLERKTNQF